MERGALDYTPAAAMFSPDGRWITFQGRQEQPDGRTAGLWVMALDGPGGRLLAQIGEKEFTSGTLALQLLGWTRDNQVVFARQGTQPDGAHQGQRGISLWAAAPEQGEAREFAWLPVPEGMVRQILFNLREKEAFSRPRDDLPGLFRSPGVQQVAEID
ncbi:hypothetical protein [Desulfofundulus kuznetsovii]